MDAVAVLKDFLSRPVEVAHRVADHADADLLNRQVEGAGNSISWLLWHTAREIDVQVAPLTGDEQIWTAKGWVRRFALPFEDSVMGYGQSTVEAGQVQVSDPALLTGYLDDAAAALSDYLDTLSETDLDRVIDTHWDPPVTLGVRLVSIVDDAAQHLGQAAYAAGLPAGR